MAEFSHIDEQGGARMVDISGKDSVSRSATAEGKVFMLRETVRLLREKLLKKGDALTVAQIAGIQAAKRAWEIIPLCHQIPLEKVSVDFTIEEDGITIHSTARAAYKTGVEMEALTAVCAAALALYDMCKAADRGMRISEIRLIEKIKGESA